MLAPKFHFRSPYATRKWGHVKVHCPVKSLLACCVNFAFFTSVTSCRE